MTHTDHFQLFNTSEGYFNNDKPVLLSTEMWQLLQEQ